MGQNNARVRKVAITGISGYFGRALLPLLEQDGTVERVVGIDGRPLSVRPSEKVQFYLKDVRDPALEELLQGAEVLVHLAFVLMRLPGVRPEEIEKQNVGDARAVFEAAARAGVRKIIFVASDAPLTLQELAELRNGRVIALPYFMVRALMGALWRMGRSPLAPEWTDLLRYPLIVSNEKLKRAGWVPRYTTPEALQTLLVAREGD